MWSASRVMKLLQGPVSLLLLLLYVQINCSAFNLAFLFSYFFYSQGEFFGAIKVGYTIGHSVSLISLTIAIIILCLFR